MEIEHPANRDRERRQPSTNHRAVEDESRVGRAVVLLDPLHDRVAADLLLAVERETHVHRELAGCGELRGRLDEDQEVDLVVGDAARVQTSVARRELEGRRLPELERVGRLYVEVRVAEDRGRLFGSVGRAHLADHERTAHAPRDDLRGATSVTDPGGNPRRGRLHVRRVRRVGAHGRDGDQLGKRVAERVGGRRHARESSQASPAGQWNRPSLYSAVMRFTAAVTHEDAWYVARCLEIEVTSQGTTVDEALASLKEALELYFENEPLPEGLEPPLIETVEIAA